MNREYPAQGGDEPTIDLLDLEEHAKAGHDHVPCARRYRIRIDRKHYVVEVPKMNGTEILALAGHTPQSHKLFQKRRGCRPDPVGPKEVIDFRKPGIERFTTIPIDPGDGFEPRREFDLPEEDIEALEELLLPWEAIKDGGRRIVLVHKYPIHPGYNHERATAALHLQAGYNDSQIDMVFFYPVLARKDGVAIPATGGRLAIDGKKFQQWSRHRTAANPWRPGVDGIGTHMLMVDDWLAREFRNN